MPKQSFPEEDIKQIAEYPIPDEGIPQKMEIPKHVLDYYHTNKK